MAAEGDEHDEAGESLLRVLHALRLVGFGDVPIVAERSGYSGAHVESVLEIARASEWVTYRSGRMTGWSLTVVGRSHGERLLAGEVARHGALDAVGEGYRRFRELNQRFLDLCTEWQLRPDGGELVVNDHADAEYDEAVIAGLAGIDDAIQPILADIARALVRFDGYRPRLASARRHVEAGDRDWFTRPVIDSYHTVWFELHEDLLATLGLERASEH